MKISRKTDYALRVLFDLIAEHSKGPISIRELAQRNDVPKRFLEQIMLEMKSRGWVNSSAGKEGGYFLAKEPKNITMGEVVRHFDGILAPIGCVSVTGYEPCTQEKRCRFRRLFLDVRNYIARLMDHASLASVYLNLPVAHREVFTHEFVAGDGI